MPALVGCTSTNTTDSPHLRFDIAAFEDFEGEFDAGSFGSVEGDLDYSSFRVGVGILQRDAETARPIGRAELALGFANFEDEFGDGFDGFELAGGGRYFLGASDRVLPYLSAYAVSTFFDDFAGVDFGTQFGVAFGAGVEIATGSHFSFDAGVDYLIPLVPGETDPGAIDVEVDGLAIRAGVVIDL